MSSTLTWSSSGNGAKTGTNASSYFNNLITLVNSKSSDANFKWQVAGSTVTGTVFQIVFKRKDASPGRILLVLYTTTGSTFNPTLFNQIPETDCVFAAYFPNGTTDIATALSTATGTIMGDDAGAVMASPNSSISSIYTTSMQHYYFDSEAGLLFVTQNPNSASSYMIGAGDLVVDGSDTAYPCVISSGTSTLNTLGTSGGLFSWTAPTSATPAGANPYPGLIVNYSGNNKRYYQAWNPSGSFAARVGTNDPLLDDTTSSTYFFPVQLLGQSRGEGLALKLRQIAFGPGQVSQFTVYNTTGPTVAARAMNNSPAGASGVPWVVNFKL